MFVQPIGTGGAFDAYETCYLVNETILIDCGPSSIKRTFADGRAAKIEHIFLTHIHQDHVGGVEALVYFRKYVTNTPLKHMFCPAEYLHQARALACFKDDFHNFRNATPFRLTYLAAIKGQGIRLETPHGAVKVMPFSVRHSDLDAYGFRIEDVSTGKVVIISGDADRAILLPDDEHYDLMFHDVGWEGLADCETRVHPTENDLVGAFGNTAPIITIHNLRMSGSEEYPRAEMDRIYHV